jgi:hypothetical protein
MAEAAGLAVGVVGLLGLANSIFEMVKLVDSLDHFADDYLMAGVMLTVTGARFARWKNGAFPQGEGSVLHIPHVQDAQQFLEVIHRRFTDAHELLRAHGDESTEPPADTTATKPDRLRHIFKPLFRRIRFARTAKRAKWIVTDCGRLKTICDELKGVIGDLEVLVPVASATAYAAELQLYARQLEARRDFQQLAEVARAYDPRLFRKTDINRKIVSEGHVDITGSRTGKKSNISIGTRITEAVAKHGFTDRSNVIARGLRVGKHSSVQAGFQVT